MTWMWSRFHRATVKHTHGIAEEILSVYLSARLSNACIVTKRKHLAKKSSIMTNRKPPTSFPMSLRWTSYVAPKPPKGASKATNLSFPYKKWTSLEESVLQSLFVWKLSAARLNRHSLTYSPVQKWLVGDVAFCVKFWVKMTHPASKTAIFTWYSPVGTVLWRHQITVCKFM